MFTKLRDGFGTALLLAALAPAAWSFCGFYVSQEPGSLFNKSSKVVLARDGDQTTLTMANDYRGDPAEFGLVVPVPVVIEPGMVQVAERSIIDKLDQYSVPRLAEYYDEDPCPEPVYAQAPIPAAMAPTRPMSAPPPPEAMPEPIDYGVTVEREYKLEEYSIQVISAEGAQGLEAWLRKEGYQIPEGASGILASYLAQKVHFFLAKIDLGAQKELGLSWPRPLRVSYTSPKFMLPIRLGTINADGAQDLLVFALTPTGRVETTNYRTAKIPTEINVPEYLADQGNFATFYQTTFDRQVRRDGMHAVWLEYAWPLSVQCDPCSGAQLSGAELDTLGASWASDYHGGMNGGFLTRLHVRYDARHFPEDLVFQETKDAEPWQVRYVVQHRFQGDTSCPEGQRYIERLRTRQASEISNLAWLTGWAVPDIEPFIP